MGSLRALTGMLILLVLVPAGVLAWLGLGSAERLESEASQRLRRELDDAERDLRVLGALRGRAFDRRLEEAMALAAEDLRRAQPLAGPAAGMARARDCLRATLPTLRWHLGGGRVCEYHGLVDLRLLDAEGRAIHPPEFRPHDGRDQRPSRQGLFAELERRADRLLYGGGDAVGAAAVWEEARDRLPATAASAIAAAQVARIRVNAGKTSAAAAARGLEAAFSPAELLRAGRPVLQLWLAAAASDPTARSWLAHAERSGVLGRTPLTTEERRRARELAAAGATGLPPDDPRTWAAWDRAPVFVAQAEVVAGATLRAEYAESWAWSVFATDVSRAWDGHSSVRVVVNRPENVHPDLRRPAFEAQREFHGGGWGGRDAGYVLIHEETAALQREARSRRRWSWIGVGALLLLMTVGILLVGRAVRRERAARRLRDDFIANVSHELRTPLTSVCFHAEMLADEDPPPDRRRRLAGVVRAEGARLAALVDDLLDFSALQRGVRRLEPEPVDLAAAARSAAEPYRVLAEREDVRIDVEGADREVLALADAGALSRILANLLSNAWRHGRPSRDGGPGRIHVRMVDGRAPAVDVRDDGPGIPAGERVAVFERFRRGAHSGRVAGTGLGLALGRELARAMEGELAIVDDARATVFRLTLPPVPDPDEEGG